MMFYFSVSSCTLNIQVNINNPLVLIKRVLERLHLSVQPQSIGILYFSYLTPQVLGNPDNSANNPTVAAVKRCRIKRANVH